MNAQEIRASTDFQRCAAFHGHVCPGLAIGYKAAKAAMRFLQQQQRAEDEELVAIVETDACSADAVQVLTGCTFGKGNFIYKDHGKMALTLLDRNTGQGVRVCTKPRLAGAHTRHGELLQKMMAGSLNEAERAEFQQLHQQRSDAVLETPDEELFTITATHQALPPKARMEPSKPCSQCGEPVMGCKLQEVDGRLLCRSCLPH
ncbi:MAG: FmdE family protein [Brachymonas sp.]|nr:FmdE family protein [Brachymonas sp.]